MTREELDSIIRKVDETAVLPNEPMTLNDMKTYLRGFEDARNAMLDSVDACYREMKTD